MLLFIVVHNVSDRYSIWEMMISMRRVSDIPRVLRMQSV